MPYYDYSCGSCQESFECFQKYENCDVPASDPCPKCSQKTVTRQIGAPSFGDAIKLKIKRPDSAWNDVLGKVKKAHPHGNWDTKFSPRSGR